VGSSNKKKNAKQGQLHDNTETGGATSTSGIKNKEHI
jgi:hypothetical protein